MTETSAAVLKAIGAEPGPVLNLAEAALALGQLALPDVNVTPYRRHLALIGGDVRMEMGGRIDTLQNRVEALREVIVETYGYRGDSETYDDPANANLIRVIDRRRGLPVALGIIYLAAARSLGWTATGLAFPSHFLIRLEAADGRAILDPFNGGIRIEASDLRRRLTATLGASATLTPEHYSAVDDRAVLLRLQNNIKLRLIKSNQPDAALKTVESMLLFAPQEAVLWSDAALLNAHIGNLNHARDAIRTYLGLAQDGERRHAMAALMQRLDASLN